MDKSQFKITGVVFEYSDGPHQRIVDEYLPRWLEYINSLSQLAAIHGTNPFDRDPVQLTPVCQHEFIAVDENYNSITHVTKNMHLRPMCHKCVYKP